LPNAMVHSSSSWQRLSRPCPTRIPLFQQEAFRYRWFRSASKRMSGMYGRLSRNTTRISSAFVHLPATVQFTFFRRCFTIMAHYCFCCHKIKRRRCRSRTINNTCRHSSTTSPLSPISRQLYNRYKETPLLLPAFPGTPQQEAPGKRPNRPDQRCLKNQYFLDPSS
jgi:hypothetical protein